MIRGGRDRGVFQPVSVGLMVVTSLLITTGVVAVGPQIGGRVADYLMCELVPGDHCADRSTAQPSQPAERQTPQQSQPGGLVTVVDLSGDCAGAAQFLAEIFPDGHWTGEQFQTLAQTYGVQLPTDFGLAAGLGGTVAISDCQLVIKTDDDLSNPGEVNTDTWADFGRAVAVLAIGLVTGLSTYVLCMATVVLEPMCPALAGYSTGFFGAIAEAAIRKHTLDFPDVMTAFAAGIAGFALGMAPLLDPLAAKIPGILSKLGAGIEKAFSKMWGWVQKIAKVGKDLVVDWLNKAATYLEEHPLFKSPPRPGQPAPPANPPGLKWSGPFPTTPGSRPPATVPAASGRCC
jgi:hypothetical protein